MKVGIRAASRELGFERTEARRVIKVRLMRAVCHQAEIAGPLLLRPLGLPGLFRSVLPFRSRP
jgi:hypothetical protein